MSKPIVAAKTPEQVAANKAKLEAARQAYLAAEKAKFVYGCVCPG